MKKILFTGAAAACCLTMAVPAFAYTPKKIGTVYSTDIIAYIDKTPIRSYNYSNLTYVMAKDLRNYGFAVDWNENARTVNITLPESRTIKALSPAEREALEIPDRVGEKRYDVYQTDITTMLGGVPMSNTGVPAAINVDGKTLVRFSDLGDHFGTTEWNDQHRIAQIHTENAPECSEVFTTDFGLTYKETNKWDSHYIMSSAGAIPAAFWGSMEKNPQAYGLGIVHINKTDETGNEIRNPDGRLCGETYLSFRQTLINDFGLELSGKDSKELSLHTSKTEVSLKSSDVSLHYFPAFVYETDLSLYADGKKIEATDFPVFLNIDHSLYIRSDALAQALNMTHTLNEEGEGTFEKIAE